VRFAHFYRSNLLDLAVCNVRDCFGPGSKIGYPVFATNGTRTSICFQRRSSKVKVKAHIDTSILVKHLQRREGVLSKAINSLRPLTENGKSFTHEDLFAYEYTRDEDVFVQSRDVWINFLSFAIDIDKATLTTLMRKYQGTLTVKPHSDVVENIDDVIVALKNAHPPLDHYLRY